MKKRVIISIVLLLIAFGTCALSFTLIANELGKLRNSLYDAIYTAGDVGVSADSTQTVQNNWNESKKSFEVFLDEKDVDELEKLIPSLSDSLMHRDVNRYLETCFSCIHYLDRLFDSISLSVGSVL